MQSSLLGYMAGKKGAQQMKVGDVGRTMKVSRKKYAMKEAR